MSIEMAHHPESPMPSVASRPSRNDGIDILRVIAMFYVIILHTLGGGGVLSTAEPGSSQYIAAWGLEIFAYGAVDIFALISGYVSYTEHEKKVNPSNYIVLWCQAVALGLGATLLFKLFHPELVTQQDFIDMCLPITNDLYWYLTAYTGLFILMPLLNAGLRKCSVHSAKKLFLALITAFSVYDFTHQRFLLNNGYSAFWIVILYLLGAIIKKCDIGKRLKVWHTFLAIIALFLFSWYWYLNGFGLTKSRIVSYLSPTILISSIFYVIGFSKLRIHPKLHSLISFAASGTFAAYILNGQRFIWQYELANRFTYLASYRPIIIITQAIGFSFAFVIVSILIDHLRIWCFQILRIRPLADRLVLLVNKLLAYWK